MTVTSWHYYQTLFKPLIVRQCETQGDKRWLPGLRQHCKHACVIRALGCVFRVYYAIRDGPVTSSCISQCRSLFGHTVMTVDSAVSVSDMMTLSHAHSAQAHQLSVNFNAYIYIGSKHGTEYLQ